MTLLAIGPTKLGTGRRQQEVTGQQLKTVDMEVALAAVISALGTKQKPAPYRRSILSARAHVSKAAINDPVKMCECERCGDACLYAQ